MAKNRIKITEPTPRNRAEMEALVGEITALTIDARTLKNSMDDELARVRERYEGRIDGLEQTIKAKTQVAQIWAEDNAPEFGARKSISFLHGVVGFRTGTPKLKTLAGFTWDRVLEKVSKLFPEYVRTKEEVARDLIIEDREAIGEAGLKKMGLECVQTESFFVEPALEKQETRIASAA